MRIAVFHELHNGGARRAVNEFAKRLRKNNIIDLYIVDQEKNKKENKFFNNVFFYKFVPKKWSGGNWKAKLYKDTVDLYKLKMLHQIIARVIDNKNYDLVFVHPSKFTQSPFILRFLRTLKVYYSEEALRIAYEPQFGLTNKIPRHKRIYEKLVRVIRKKIDKGNITKADIVLANSNFTKKNIKKAYGVESKVVYLGVDANFFKPSRIGKDIDVLYIGAKDQTDGYFLLKRAVSKVSEKISVKYHITSERWISDKDLRELYNRSKIVACLAKSEPFGLIPIEAASCKVPVIALNDGGYRETVTHGKTGFLVSANPADIAKKIEWLRSHPKEAIEMGEKGREIAKFRWQWKRQGDLIEKLFKKLINNDKD